MATRERPVDRGTVRARRIILELGQEVRRARLDRGLNLVEVARATSLSTASVSRIERGLIEHVAVLDLARLLAVVGLDLWAKAYPGGRPIRDAAHARLLDDFGGRLHRSLRWAVEVPLPRHGDQRAWDGFVRGTTWRYGVEAETSPTDGQALGRRLQLKLRDGDVDGILLIMPGTRAARQFLREAGDGFSAMFPVPGPRALELLGVGADPGGSSIIVLPHRHP